MAWDGVERRSKTEYCPAHIDLVSDLAVIKNSLKNIEKTIVEGVTFRSGMIIAMVGVTMTLVIQITFFANLYGQLSNQVKVNTNRLSVIEETHRARDVEDRGK